MTPEPTNQSELAELANLIWKQGSMTSKQSWGAAKVASSYYAELSESYSDAVQQNEVLLNKIKDLQQEIARHHKDFARWEEMAAKGARQIERTKELEEKLVVARGALEEVTELEFPKEFGAGLFQVVQQIAHAALESIDSEEK